MTDIERTPCEGEGEDQSDVFISRGMPEIASNPPELGERMEESPSHPSVRTNPTTP